jgi:two-component system LytT family sensor kinase
MSEPSPPSSDDAPAAAPVRIVALSIAGFWAFYFAVSTARALMSGKAGQVLMLGPRLLVSLISIAATAIVYLVLRRVRKASFASSILVAMIVSIPGACIYGATNWYMFDRVLPSLKRAAATPAQPAPWSSVTVGAQTDDDMSDSPLADIADTAVNGYFFFVTWCALYFALSYAAQLGALERRSAQLKAAAQAAELRALRYQINPHFLFNTMNSLSSLVMTGRSTEAERMIVGLSTFFRASLTDDPTEDVMLVEEIALQRLYLEIEMVRFGDRLRLEIDLPAELETACVPGLILQPLVENVVKHAVSRTRDTVILRIEAREAAGRLVLMVKDNGPAAPRLEDEEPGGVGLANVRDRIAARFGPDGSVVWGGADNGFSVTLVVPLLRDGC